MPNARLDIVGDGRLRGYLEQLAKELRVFDRVTFHGDVPHHELVHFYQTSRYLLMTSQHEAFGMAALEAFACGMKIIGTATGILPQLGWVSKFGRLEDFLTNVIGRERSFSPQKIQLQHDMVEAHYSVQHMTASIVNIYEAVLGA